MSQKKVIITLGKDGSIKTEASGFKGGSCKEKTKFLNDTFGKVSEETLKPSYYEIETETETDLIINGLPSEWCG